MVVPEKLEDGVHGHAVVLYTVELPPWPELQDYVVPKHVMLFVERNLPVVRRGGMVDGEMWSYGQGFTVRRVLLSVDTACFVSWLVHGASRYKHSVPSIPLLWQLDWCASVCGRGKKPSDGNCGQGPERQAVLYVLYVPPRARGLYGDASGVGLEAVGVSLVATLLPPALAKNEKAGRNGTIEENTFYGGVPDEVLVSSCA